MNEHRGYFRIANPGRIRATYQGEELVVLDISLSGALIKRGNVSMQTSGVLELVINHFNMTVPYDWLRDDGDKSILTFRLQGEYNHLLAALKNIRSHTESQTPIRPVTWHEDWPKIERFTRLDTVYAIRLYLLVHQYRQVGHEIVGLDYLRLALGVDMFEAYRSYPELRQHILEPAIEEINRKTDLIVRLTEICSDDTVAAVKFTMVSIVL